MMLTRNSFVMEILTQCPTIAQMVTFVENDSVSREDLETN